MTTVIFIVHIHAVVQMNTIMGTMDTVGIIGGKTTMEHEF